MNKEKKKTMVPKLRFPEFREAEEWVKKQLKDACQMQSGKFVSASEIYENRNKDLYPCYGGNGLRGYTKSYTHNGQYSLIGRQGALCGNVTLASGKFHATEHALVATPKEGIDNDWLYYKLLYLELNQYATGQAQPGLSVENLEKVDIVVPRKEPEQQKIAATLSSLDDLISAQSEKIKALKAHKKGLMQQLFPAEGERAPRVRFGEFEGKGAWEEKALGDAFNFKQGIQCPVEEQSLSEMDGYVRFIRIVDLTKNDEPIRYIKNPGSEHLIDTNDLFMVRYGTPGLVGYNFKGVIANNLFRIIPKSNHKVFNKFYYFVFNHLQEKIISLSGSSTMPALNFTTLNSLSVPYPTISEQQKIADCLSSLDDLIAAQSQKLEALKAHKKGLMQQLFPNVTET